MRALLRRPLLGASVLVLLSAGALSTAVGIALGLASFNDVGYPESATLLRVGEFAGSGSMYPDINRPPYLVTLYGPLTYALLATPYIAAKAAGIDPQALVRLTIAGAFCLSVLLIFLIGNRLYGSRPAAWLCALFAVSALPLASWTTQIRPDLLALSITLLSAYLFLTARGKRQLLAAALCAGTALLVKQTFIALPLAILSWFIVGRRYKDALSWAAVVMLTVSLGYTIAWWREPLMLQHIAALSHPVREYHYGFGLIWLALLQPAAPFAAIGGALGLQKRSSEQFLFVLYCAFAWLVAILTIPQIGGNVNYFWEPLFASALLAGPALGELQRKAPRTPIAATFLLLLLFFRSFFPMLRDELVYLKTCYADARDYRSRKAKWESLLAVVSGRKLLSTLPALTLHSSTPEVPDPYLNSVLALAGTWSFRPVIDQINAGQFELIITGSGEAEGHRGDGYRGVRNWNDDKMWTALKQTYTLACVFDQMDIWVSRRGARVPGLDALGCQEATKQDATGARTTNR
jgi:hypothetical protein